MNKEFKNKLALVYGILLGDGCLSFVKDKYYFISIVGNIDEDIKFFKTVLTPYLEYRTHKKIKIKKRPKQRKIEINFTDKRLFLLLREIGFPIGKKGTRLKMTDFFNDNQKRYVMQGYFSSDGSLVIANNNGTLYPRIEFSSISKLLLTQVFGYLKDKRMKGNIYVSHRYTNKNWNTLYRLQFNGKANLNLFINKIGLVNPKHIQKLKEYKKMPLAIFEIAISASLS